MKVKEGDVFKILLNEAEYVVKKIVNKMVILESKNGEAHLLTGIDNLGIKSFYQKKEEVKAWDKM